MDNVYTITQLIMLQSYLILLVCHVSLEAEEPSGQPALVLQLFVATRKPESGHEMVRKLQEIIGTWGKKWISWYMAGYMTRHDTAK